MNAIFVLAISLLASLFAGSGANDKEEPGPQPEPEPEPSEPTGEAAALYAAPSILSDNQLGTQTWGDGVTLTAYDLNNNLATVAYSEEFDDHGFGVAGGRWDGQIDFYSTDGYKSGEGNSEKLIIDFNGAVTDVTLRVGMLGVTEGPTVNGQEMIETGTWTALDADDNVVATGLIGADQSSLGSMVKESGSYGIYPIDIYTDTPFEQLILEATQFGHGEGYSVDAAYGENSSDFTLMGVEYTRVGTPALVEDLTLADVIPITDVLTETMPSEVDSNSDEFDDFY